MQILPFWARQCPVCGVLRLRPALTKILWETPEASSSLRCDNCRALFTRKGDKFELTYVKNTTREFWLKYHNQPMSSEEWDKVVAINNIPK